MVSFYGGLCVLIEVFSTQGCGRVERLSGLIRLEGVGFCGRFREMAM